MTKTKAGKNKIEKKKVNFNNLFFNILIYNFNPTVYQISLPNDFDKQFA